MAKTVFNKIFDATDTRKGISIRVFPGPDPQDFPEWVIKKAEEAGAATRSSTQSAAKAAPSKDE